jgi:hypothetical protein
LVLRVAEALADSQQQTVQTRFRQHASVEFAEDRFGVDADASVTTDNIPATATRASRESRNMWRRSVMTEP